MNNDMKEQPAINFEKDLEGTHEIFTNLPNNTLNGVNPIFNENNEQKTEVMENLVNEVKEEIPQEPVVTESVIEVPVETSQPVQVEEPVQQVANEVTMAEPVQETIASEPVIPVQEPVATEPVKTETKPKKSMVGILIIAIIISLAVGSGSTYLILSNLKPAPTETTNDAGGSSGVTKLDYVKSNLADFNNTYDDGEITDYSSELIKKTLKDSKGNVLNVLNNGTISLVTATDNTVYKPLEIDNAKLKYYYSFYTEKGYYIVTTEGKVYLLEYEYNENNDVINKSLLLVSENAVATVGAKCVNLNTKTYEVVIIDALNNETKYENVLGVDLDITKA